MAIASVTIPHMGKKKAADSPGPGRPATGRTPSETVFARVEPRIHKALENHVKKIRPRTSMAAVVSLAIEQYLERVGEPIDPAEQEPAE